MPDVPDVDFSVHCGYRLHRLEVLNWGTFDSAGESTRGTVYQIEPAGESTLLIGKNGSGKSTLVDALLTLLVRPAIRNYNVAAGAGKRERDERSYLKGAFERRSRQDEPGTQVRHLRDAGSHSLLLACFRNEDSDRCFTLAQVLYSTSDGRVDKVYCFAADERSIAADCSGLRGTDRLRQQMRERGFRATKSYTEYHEWFRQATGVQPKAMDMLNQTVAVKDIQRLNDFIREHMLEARPWDEKVDRLLGHFTQLSAAHQSLVRVRRQFQLLQPIEEQGAAYRREATQFDQTQCIVDAADSFFRHKAIEVFEPACEAQRTALARIATRKRQLADEISAVHDECRRLTNDIEASSGDRMREIPLLIKTQELRAAAKRATHTLFHRALRDGGIEQEASDQAQFAEVQGRLARMADQIEGEIAACEDQRLNLRVQIGEVTRSLQSDERELSALEEQHGNLPEWATQVRKQLCDELCLPVNDLPFAAELVRVNPDESKWLPSIELVLRDFALSLLVPPRHYRLVSSHLERSRLTDARGRGQRLVYLRVGDAPADGGVDSSESLIHKIQIRPGHPLAGWVSAELQRRFDYQCCETIEEFQQHNGRAITTSRHIKSGAVRHTKDDRERVSDPRHHVLGWENSDKRRTVSEAVHRQRAEASRLDGQAGRLDEQLAQLRRRQAAIGQARQVPNFADLDWMSHQDEIASLYREQQRLADNDDTMQLFGERLAERRARVAALQFERDRLLKEEGELDKALADGEMQLEKARRSRHADFGPLDRHAESFAAIEATLGDRPLSADDLFAREAEFKQSQRAELERVRGEIEPLRLALAKSMNRFLREFPHERSDLDADTEYLKDFLDLLEEIRAEDLPRHERRFKDRLNDKVTREIGLLNGELQRDRSAIEDKVELLNEALGQLEYRPGTHMRLEARLVRDREIAEFRNSLAECLPASWQDSSDLDEVRFLQVEQLVRQLREEERWRNKVTDVRRWFDFAAREIDTATGEERGYYEDSAGQSGGEKAKLAFTILVAAIAYQYDLDPSEPTSDRFHFVIVDEMFSKIDDQYSEYALELFRKFRLQLLIVAPLDAKARVTEPYVGCYCLVSKDDDGRSVLHSMTCREFAEQVEVGASVFPRTSEPQTDRLAPRPR